MTTLWAIFYSTFYLALMLNGWGPRAAATGKSLRAPRLIKAFIASDSPCQAVACKERPASAP
jgi:hypothetical protein